MDDRKTNGEVARKASRAVILFYVIVKPLLEMPDHFEDLDYLFTRILASAVISYLTFSITRLKLSNRLTPLLVTISAVVPELIWVAFAARGDWEIYIFLIGCSLVSMLYLDSMGLLLSMLFSCSALAVFSYGLNVTLTGLESNEDVYGFSAVVLANVLIFFVCKYSVGGFEQFLRIGRIFNIVMQTTPNYIAVINEQAKVEYVSKSLAEWLDIEKQEYAVGLPFIDIFPSGDMKLLFGEFMRRKGPIEDTFEVKIDGQARWFILRSVLINESKAARFFEWMDITPIMEAQKGAEAAAQAKSDFLAKMSHEIRTPMNAVMGMSELILRKELPQDVYEDALMIKNASTNLLSIINDILDFSKIESGKLEIIEAEYMFSSLVNDIVSIVKVRLMDKPVRFTVEIDPKIPFSLIGDEVRIRQVLINLMSNAVKYTHEGNVSLLVAGEMRDQTVMLTIGILDTGVGIKEEDLGKLFGDFIQIDLAANQGIEGTGLGLAISRNLCRAMGGDITVKSEYGKGSLFTVTLPQAFKEYTPFASVEAPGKHAVLIYETRTDYRDSIMGALDQLGVACKSVGSVSELLSHVEEYDFVFLSSTLYDSVRQNGAPSLGAAKLTLLADITETAAPKDVRVLQLPAHSLSIANVLNDVGETREETGADGFSFTAPDAKILIVDDVAANLKVAEGLMLPYQMQITLCSSGRDAVSLVSQTSYDLVFMDHMMPGMDGLETTRQIRALEGESYRTLPIIALTANAVSGVREMYLANGLNDFLAKPIETAKLNDILDTWIPKEKRKRAEPPKQTEESSALIHQLLSVPALSVQRALSVVGGSAETYERIVRLAIRLVPENIEKLNRLIDTDLPNYAIEVHGVKGVLNSIGAYSLGEMALELERRSKKGEHTACKELHPLLMEELGSFYDAMAHILGAQDAQEKTEGDMALLPALLEQLREAVAYYDSPLALELLSPIAAQTFGEQIDAALDAVTRAFEHFDFDRATEELDRIGEELAGTAAPGEA